MLRTVWLEQVLADLMPLIVDGGGSQHDSVSFAEKCGELAFMEWLSQLHRAPVERDEEKEKEGEDVKYSGGLLSEEEETSHHVLEVKAPSFHAGLRLLPNAAEMGFDLSTASTYPPRGAQKCRRAYSPSPGKDDVAVTVEAEEDDTACTNPGCHYLQRRKNFLLECVSWTLHSLELNQELCVQTAQRDLICFKNILLGFAGNDAKHRR